MKPAFDLDNLRVATPCPKAWADMIGDDRYSLTIKLAPFKSLTLTDLLLEKKAAVNIDITLELSGTEVVGLLMANPSMIDLPPGSFTMSGDLLIRFPH